MHLLFPSSLWFWSALAIRLLVDDVILFAFIPDAFFLSFSVRFQLLSALNHMEFHTIIFYLLSAACFQRQFNMIKWWDAFHEEAIAIISREDVLVDASGFRFKFERESEHSKRVKSALKTIFFLYDNFQVLHFISWLIFPQWHSTRCETLAFFHSIFIYLRVQGKRNDRLKVLFTFSCVMFTSIQLCCCWFLLSSSLNLQRTLCTHTQKPCCLIWFIVCCVRFVIAI